MSIERISATEFLVGGLPSGMFQNLDDEAYYEGDEEGRQSERARDERRDWLTQQGWDTYVDDAGETQTWYPGMGLPDPLRRVTKENRDSLDHGFFTMRLIKAATSRPEGKWLLDEKLWKADFVTSYNRAGTIRVVFDSEADASRFAQAFSN